VRVCVYVSVSMCVCVYVCVSVCLYLVSNSLSLPSPLSLSLRVPVRSQGHSGDTPFDELSAPAGWLGDQDVGGAGVNPSPPAKTASGATTDAATDAGDVTAAVTGASASTDAGAGASTGAGAATDSNGDGGTNSEAVAEMCLSCVFNPPGGIILSVPAVHLHSTRSSSSSQLPAFLSSLESLLLPSSSSSSSSSSSTAGGEAARGDMPTLADLQRAESSAESSGARRTLLAVEVAVRDRLQSAPDSTIEDTATLTDLLQFLQRDDVLGSTGVHSADSDSDSAAAVFVFLEVFRVSLRDVLLEGAGSLAPLVFGASHSHFERTTALYE
jgi:hypothetical protein